MTATCTAEALGSPRPGARWPRRLFQHPAERGGLPPARHRGCAPDRSEERSRCDSSAPEWPASWASGLAVNGGLFGSPCPRRPGGHGGALGLNQWAPRPREEGRDAADPPHGNIDTPPPIQGDRRALLADGGGELLLRHPPPCPDF